MTKVLCVSLLSIAALLPSRAEAQVLCTLGPATPYDSLADMPGNAAAQADLKKVKSLLCPKGCGKVVLFANPTAPNAATVNDGAGTSKIAYSPSFVNGLKTTYGPIATMGILAHGLGHHLEATGNRPAWMKAAWDSELRADAWAGCAMAKAELTPSRLQAALLALSTYPSARHPEWTARRAVITEGYTQCGGRILPPLAKEGTEKAAKVDGGKGDATVASAAPSGCSGDKDCRNGRTCVKGRCGAPPERRRCGKDTDCPDPEECGPAGYCSGAASQERGQAQAQGDDVSKPAGPMLAALQSERPDAPAPAKDAATCARSCDETRNQCVEAAKGGANKCVTEIQAEANYKSCACPNYPAGDFACFTYCTSAYDRAKSCSSANKAQECKTEGDRCRSQCR
jgi:hypothetical protein